MTIPFHPELTAEEAARHLADLLEPGAPDGCAGDLYSIQRARELLDGTLQLPGFDIDRDLANPYEPMRRRDAAFIALAYLLRAGAEERAALLPAVQPDWLPDRIARYFLTMIWQYSPRGGDWVACIQAELDGCGPRVFGQLLNPTLRLSVYQWWFTTLATAPTRQQFDRAVSILTGFEMRKEEAR